MRLANDVGPPGVRLLRFGNDPANVLTLPLVDALADAWLALGDEVAVVVLASDGPTFSAGVDVAVHAPARVPDMLRSFHRLLRAVLHGPAIPIALVQGPALGGGCELVLACDLVLASERASFGQPEIDVGCFPPLAAALLPERAGLQRAARMVYSGRPVSAGEAAACGLVERVVPPGDLQAACDELLEELGSKSRPALRAARAALVASRREEVERRLVACERIYLEQLTRTEDAAEGVRAFLEKRPPRWRHR